MVSIKRARSQRAFDSQALLSFLSWVRVLWSGCFGNVVHFKRPRFSAAMERSQRTGQLLQARSRGCPAEEESEEGYYAVLEDDGEEEEEWGMLEGRFYVGTRIPTEVELRSPVEEKTGVATIVKSSSIKARAHSLPRQKHVIQERPQPTLRSRAKSWENVTLFFTGIEDAFCATEEIAKASCQEKSKDVSDGEKDVCCTETHVDIAGTSQIVATYVPETHIDVAGGPDIGTELTRASAQISNVDSRVTCPCKETGIVADESELEEVEFSPGCKTCPSNRTVKVDAVSEEGLARTCSRGRLKPRIGSLTDHDFAELRGCIDLGFVFTEEDSVDLRATLPALQACYAVSQGAILPTCNCKGSRCTSQCGTPEKMWRIASPGDQPQQVKTRLRHWAQAVACTVRQSY